MVVSLYGPDSKDKGPKEGDPSLDYMSSVSATMEVCICLKLPHKYLFNLENGPPEVTPPLLRAPSSTAPLLVFYQHRCVLTKA